MLDQIISRHLLERIQLSKRIQEAKHRLGLPQYDGDRESQIIGAQPEALKNVYRSVLDASRKRE